MSRSTTYVIIGGGLAGAKAAEALRDNDFDGHIVLFAQEDHLPYERPPLSKDFLAGKKSLEEFTVQTAAWYRDHDVDLRLGTEVQRIDRPGTRSTLPDGSTRLYDKLLLATGSRSRRLPCRAPTPTGCTTCAPSKTRRRWMTSCRPARRWRSSARAGSAWRWRPSARHRGVDVTVVETAELPLLAALGPEVGAGVRRPAPRARRRPAAGDRGRRDHHRATGGRPA